MREALGLSLENTPEEAIERYYVLYKLLNQAEIKTINLTKEEKNNTKLHIKIDASIINDFLPNKPNSYNF